MKTVHLGVRIEAHLNDRLQNVANRMGLEKPTLVREAIKALITYAERRGKLIFPLEMIEPEDQPLKAAEDPGHYGPSGKQ